MIIHKLLPGYWPMKRKQIRLAILVTLLALTGIGLLFIIWIDRRVVGIGKRRIISLDDLAGTGPYDCLIVPGALIYPGGIPGPMLQDRLEMAVKIYRSGLTGRILISGDSGQDDYDEVSVMRDYLIREGIDPEHILMDREGFDTYETMYRAKHEFSVSKAIVTTQTFHLLRALYMGEHLGMQVQGIASDLRRYKKIRRFRLREYFARFKAYWDCEIRKVRTKKRAASE